MRYRLIPVLLAAALLAGCGSDTTSESGQSAAPGSNGSTDPVTLAALWEISGESPVAIDDYQNGAQIALDQINEAGGVLGRELQLERFAANPNDPQNTLGALRKALDVDPAGMIGFLVSGQLLAANPSIDDGGVPVIAIGNADPTVVVGADGSSELTWFINSYSPALVDAGTRYLVEDLDTGSIAVMGTKGEFGESGVATAISTLDDLGLEPAGSPQFYAPDATDLTRQVLDMKDNKADAVINWGYPNPLAVQLNQLLANGMSIPTLTGPSAPVVVDNALAEGEAISDLYAVMSCNPDSDDWEASKSFVAAYTDKFGHAPSSNAALAHDAVLVMAAAIEKAGTDDPAAVQEALSSVKVDSGACGQSYEADAGHLLNHQIQVISYDGEGNSTSVKNVTIDPITSVEN